MQITKTVEVSKCDFCGADEHVYDKCLRCGKDACFDCKKTVGVEYGHAVYARGSGDGFFCNPCDQVNGGERNNPLWLAYRKIRQLRNEYEGFYSDFQKRTKQAEGYLQALLKGTNK